jgi:hypothetical protein
MKKWLLRILGLAFWAAALLQYISYNTISADGSEPGALTLIIGWMWTVLIAFPGIVLFGLSSRK